MKYFLIVLFLFASLPCKPQHNDSQAAVYNILSSSIIGGVGAIINKKPSEKTGKIFLKGVYQGALGGYVVFESKRVLRQFSRTNNYGYIWPSKILNSVGNSMVYNAASNRNLWERYHINIGFNHLEYDLKRVKKLRYRILPFSFIKGIQEIAEGGVLDLKRSFASGFFVFKRKDISLNYLGRVLANSIEYVDVPDVNFTDTITHEIIHSYQYEESFSINSYLNKTKLKLKNESRFYKKYTKLFFTDLNYILENLKLITHETFGVHHGDRFYEKEAIYYEL